VDTLRKKLKKEGLKKDIKVTFLPFLMKAVSIVLKEMPKFNSSLNHTEENLIIKNYINIGVAVDTPSGLMVPCVKDVDKKNIFELSKELMELSSKARNKKLKPEDLKGSCFTISSLGGIGGTAFSPIVNPPEVAIMGVSRSEWSPVFDKKSKGFEPKYLMPFSVSYDHRVIDGAAAATFTSRINQVLLNVDNFTK
jgi:pyruvate dehydrogenase E2 component (dihydrolipoamide acetyltransferase)